MRPDRFQTLLTNQLPSVPGILKAVTFADAGHDRSKHGIVLHHHNGTRTWWQIIATSRGGDDYAQPEATPATGERLPELPVPDLSGASVPTSEVEAALVAVLTHADTAGETARIDRYSLRETPGAVSHGLTVDFYDGSRIFVYGVASAREGRELRPSDYFKIDATV
jgi:hypothetical protein